MLRKIMRSMPIDIFEELVKCPDAVLVVKRFKSYLKEEQLKRQVFYEMLHENVKAEFINGQVILHSPARLKHLKVSSNIAKVLLNYVTEKRLGFVGIEKMMIELSRNCYEPDIVFFGKEKADSFQDDQKLFPVPDLVVEILSESARENDYGIKFKDYAAHGVKEYWIVCPDEQQVEQYVLQNGQFVLVEKLLQKGHLKSHVISGFETDVASFF